MLPQKFRLPHSVFFSQSKVFHTSFFVVKSVPSPFPSSRFGFIISKKVSKLAAVRNQTKRKVRNCIEEKWVGKLQGVDVLFIIKPAAIAASREQIAEEVEKTMVKIQESRFKNKE